MSCFAADRLTFLPELCRSKLSTLQRSGRQGSVAGSGSHPREHRTPHKNFTVSGGLGSLHSMDSQEGPPQLPTGQATQRRFQSEPGGEGMFW